MSHAQNRWLTLGTSLVVMVLLGAACDSGDDDAAGGAGSDADRTTTTVAEAATTILPETTTTAAPTPEEEVLATYQGYWAAVNDAFSPPEVNPESPGLRQYATGDVLPGIVKSAEDARAESHVVRIPEGGQYSHRAEVLSIEDNTATVRDCNIDDSVLETAGTGEVLDDEVSTKLYVAMLVREDGQWKVAVLDRANGWEGVAGCALEP